MFGVIVFGIIGVAEIRHFHLGWLEFRALVVMVWLHLAPGVVSAFDVDDLGNQVGNRRRALDVRMAEHQARRFVLLSPEHRRNVFGVDAILEHVGNRLGQGGEEPLDHGALPVGGHEDFADLVVVVERNRDVQLDVADLGCVGAAVADALGLFPFEHFVAVCREVEEFIVAQFVQGAFVFLVVSSCHGLGRLAAVPVGGDGLDPGAVGQQVNGRDVFDGGRVGQVDGFAHRARNHRRDGRDHEDVAFGADVPGAVEDRQIFRFEIGRRLEIRVDEMAVIVLFQNIIHDGLDLIVRIAQMAQARFQHRVDDFHGTAADELLQDDMAVKRFNGRGTAVHGEGNRPRRGDNGHLGVAVAVFPAEGFGFKPDVFEGAGPVGQPQFGEFGVIDGHGRDIQFFKGVIPGACDPGVVADDPAHVRRVEAVARERPLFFRHEGRRRVGHPGHDAGERRGNGPGFVRVVGQPHGQEQGGQVGQSQTRGAELVGFAGHFFGGKLSPVDRRFEDKLSQGDEVGEAGEVVAAVFSRKTVDVNRRQIAGGVVEEGVF